MALSERLKVARSSLNLTLQGVEERTGIGVSTLSEFENGKREPRLVQLKQLADVYLRPLAFFLEDGPAVPQVVLWRTKPESPRAEEVQARLVKLAEQYHHLEVLCDDSEPCDLPFHSGRAASFSYAQAEKLAHQFRQLLGLGERPGQALLRVLEEVCKVKVFHLDFEPSGSAACTLSESFGAAILLNAKNVHWRRNFDLAHEPLPPPDLEDVPIRERCCCHRSPLKRRRSLLPALPAICSCRPKSFGFPWTRHRPNTKAN